MDHGLEKQRVLVVDNDPVQRGTLAAFLEEMSLEVLQANDAESVRQQAADGGPSLAITEWSVPGLEGPTLFTALQPQVRPVLLFTHLDLSTLNQAWKQAGLEGGFSKKQRHELLDQVKALMLKEQEPAVAGFSPYQGKQILVVEDSPTVRGFVRRALVSGLKGCVVREAEDGKAALTELALGRVHCITTDLQMPGMDGWTFLATVRQNPVLKTKPIIVFSSVITPEMTQAYKNDPFIRFIDKPSVGARVAQVVREMLALKC